MIGGIEMDNPYYLSILMREREREILKELGRGRYYAHRRRGGSGLLKKIARRFVPTFLRFKAMAGSYQSFGRDRTRRCRDDRGNGGETEAAAHYLHLGDIGSKRKRTGATDLAQVVLRTGHTRKR